MPLSFPAEMPAVSLEDPAMTKIYSSPYIADCDQLRMSLSSAGIPSEMRNEFGHPIVSAGTHGRHKLCAFFVAPARLARKHGRFNDALVPDSIGFSVRDIRMRRSAPIRSATLFRRARSSALGSAVSLISQAQRSQPTLNRSFVSHIHRLTCERVKAAHRWLAR